jgi:hypothetical protein
MRKITLLFTILAFLLSGSAIAQKTVTDGGFYFNVGTFNPSWKYLIPKFWENEDLLKPEDSELNYKLGANFEIGSFFKAADIGDHALLVKVSWLDANVSKLSYDNTFYYTEQYAVQASVLKVGPNFTYAIDDKMGVDLYYQIAPVFSFWYDNTDYGDFYVDGYDDNLREQYAIGALHTLGLGFRYDKFSAGFNMNFGSAKDIDAEKEMNDLGITDESMYKYRLPSFRISLGMKF